MQFRLHINGTANGTLIAKDLRRIADIVDNFTLNNGFLRTTLESGYATMEIPDEKPDTDSADTDAPDHS